MEEDNVTRPRNRVWPRVVGALAVTGMLFTAIAIAEELPMAHKVRKVDAPKGNDLTTLRQIAPGHSTQMPSSVADLNSPHLQVRGVPRNQSAQPMRQVTVEDTGEFAWYNGRKLPVFKPTIVRDPRVEALNAQSRGESIEGKAGALAKMLPSSQMEAPLAAVPVNCATGVGCQFPNDNVGVASGRDLLSFPIDANLEDDANGFVLGAVSDQTAGMGGTHSYISADNFEAAASGSITKLCWWGFYGPTVGASTAHTGADDCSGATPAGAHDLGTATGTFTFSNAAATRSTPFSPLCDQYDNGTVGDRFDRDVWFRWTAPATCTVTFETCDGTNLDTKIAVYTANGGGTNGCPTGDATLVTSVDGTGLNNKACDDDSGCGVDWQTFVKFNATAATTYILRVGLFPSPGFGQTGQTPGGVGQFTIRCFDADCTVGADNFTVTFYADDLNGTLPGTQLAQFTTGGNLTIDNKFATTNVVTTLRTGNLAQYQYEATLGGGGFAVTAGECYWIEIKNNITGDCDWFWQSSPDGDGRSNMNVDAGGYLEIETVNDRYDNFDLAYCVNVATDPDGCFVLEPDAILYNQDNSDFFGTVDYTQMYEVFRPGGSTPHAVTYIAATGGATGCDVTLVGQEIYALMEFYDGFDIGGNADPVYNTYLGGLLVNLGTYVGPAGSQYVSFLVSAPIGTYFVSTGNDTDVVISLRLGFVNGGVFDAEGGNASGTDSPCDTTNPGPRLSWLFAVDGGSIDETVGAGITGTYFSDGFGANPDDDRVHVGADGPLVWSGNVDGAPILELRGLPLLDCDANGVADVEQIACFNSGYFGQSGCTTGCAVFDALGTNGFIQSPFFMDPLLESGLGQVTCLPSGEDTDDSGVLDDCEQADCDEDGIPNSCELSCAAFDFVHGKPCTQAVTDGDIDTCGTQLDCNSNALPDECELEGNDCNNTGVPDECEVPPLGNLDSDCNENLVPDSCEVASGAETDCNGNGTLEICEMPFLDCNKNGVTDQCDVLLGESNDANIDGVPDECPDICLTPFDGFESSPPFVIGQGVDGIDYLVPGNGDVWQSANGTSSIEAQNCAGLGAQAYAQSADTNGATGAIGPATFSELFNSDAQGNAPTSSTLTEVTFDWKIVGPRNSDNDIRLFFIDFTPPTVDSVLLMWFSSDISSVGVADPGTLNILGPGGFTSTGVQLVANQCNQAKVIFNNLEQSVEVQIGINGGPLQTVYGPAENNILTPGANRIDFLSTSAFNSGAIPQLAGDVNSKLLIDNLQICETGAPVDCASYVGPNGLPSEDCNGDQVCDLFQLTPTSDRDGDGTLDICEGFCDDCNHNFILDSVEIAEGSADDVNANLVPDVCEPGTGYNIDFQNFTVGNVEGQHGWESFSAQNAVGEIRDDTGFSGVATKYLAVRAREGNSNPNGFVLGPRMASLGEGNMEVWAWEWRVNDPPAGSSRDFGRFFMEVLDLCEDPPTLVNNIFGIIGQRNVGMQLTTLDTNEGAGAPVDPTEVNIYLLGTPGSIPAYEKSSKSPDDVQNDVINAKFAAGLLINNRSGLADAYWGPDLNTIITNPAGANSIRRASTTETVEQIPHLTGTRWRGGDRQLMIRTDGDYGGSNDIELLVDNIRYATFTDCNGDGEIDSKTIGDNGGSAGLCHGESTGTVCGGDVDSDRDGVLDFCQDCDNDCGAFGPFPANCLDRCEINPARPGCGGGAPTALDCNLNNLPDACDVNSALPAQDLSFSPLPEYRDGGGSCDFNVDGIPDECQGGSDCNNNGCRDSYELASAGFGGTATDVNNDGILDECQADCNNNNIPDVRDLALPDPPGGNGSQDAFFPFASPDGVPDECCVNPSAPGVSVVATGDMDWDGDRDAEDYRAIQQCAGQTPNAHPDAGAVTGKGTVAGSAANGLGWDGVQCGCADFNGDGKVNEIDLQIFQVVLTGP